MTHPKISLILGGADSSWLNATTFASQCTWSLDQHPCTSPNKTGTTSSRCYDYFPPYHQSSVLFSPRFLGNVLLHICLNHSFLGRWVKILAIMVPGLPWLVKKHWTFCIQIKTQAHSRQEGQTHLSYPIHPGTIFIHRQVVETCLEVWEDIVDDPLPLWSFLLLLMIVVHDVVRDLLSEVGSFFLAQHKLSIRAAGTRNGFRGGTSSHGGRLIVMGGIFSWKLVCRSWAAWHFKLYLRKIDEDVDILDNKDKCGYALMVVKARNWGHNTQLAQGQWNTTSWMGHWPVMEIQGLNLILYNKQTKQTKQKWTKKLQLQGNI